MLILLCMEVRRMCHYRTRVMDLHVVSCFGERLAIALLDGLDLGVDHTRALMPCSGGQQRRCPGTTRSAG